MIKRTTAFIFILFANIILLAHAVIPHHYHQIKICVEASHCQDDGDEHKNAASEHEHDGDESSSSCVLKQADVLLTHQNRKDCVCNPDSDNHNHDFAVLSNNKLPEIIPICLGKISTLLATSNYSAYLAASIGLRAPPIV